MTEIKPEWVDALTTEFEAQARGGGYYYDDGDGTATYDGSLSPIELIAAVAPLIRADALREAALLMDCNCNELCRFDGPHNPCWKAQANRILALIDAPPTQGDAE
jgi:hypothetical protein